MLTLWLPEFGCVTFQSGVVATTRFPLAGPLAAQSLRVMVMGCVLPSV
jgi:hypothetical protein